MDPRVREDDLSDGAGRLRTQRPYWRGGAPAAGPPRPWTAPPRRYVRAPPTPPAVRGRGPDPPAAGPDPFADGLPTLDGARVRLRAPRAADAADVLAVFGDAGHLRYWSHGPLADLGAARAYVDGVGAGWRERRLFQWAVTEPPADRLVGTVTLVEWDREHRRAEVGFIVHPAHAGRGLATDAVRTALRFGVAEMGLHRVEADVDPDNAASLRLLERLGFRREGLLRDRWFTFGTWKDTVLLGLLAADLDAGTGGAATGQGGAGPPG